MKKTIKDYYFHAIIDIENLYDILMDNKFDKISQNTLKEAKKLSLRITENLNKL